MFEFSTNVINLFFEEKYFILYNFFYITLKFIYYVSHILGKKLWNACERFPFFLAHFLMQ